MKNRRRTNRRLFVLPAPKRRWPRVDEALLEAAWDWVGKNQQTGWNDSLWDELERALGTRGEQFRAELKQLLDSYCLARRLA